MRGATEMENLCFKEGGQQDPQMLWVFSTLKSEDFLPIQIPKLNSEMPHFVLQSFAFWGF